MKSDTMKIAFPNGGILPRDITGGEERAVSAHEAVEVPRAYGEHLISDRFAYEAKPARKSKAEIAAEAARSKLEQQLAGLREAHAKADSQVAKDKIAEKIASAEKQLVEMDAA